MATASFADIRRAFPDARVTLLLKAGREKILDGSSDHDAVIFDRAGTSLARMWRLAGDLRSRRFDLALIFPNSFRAALLAWLARIPRRVGYRRGGRGILLTDAVSYEREGRKRLPVPMPEFYAKLCEEAGVHRGDGKPRLRVTPECEARAGDYRRALGVLDGERLVGINPGASFGASKLWPPAHFAALADAITKRWGLRTILLVGPGEEPIAAEIVSRMATTPLHDPSRLLPLDVLKPIVRDLALLVTTDTGPRHYAVAFGVPAAVIMGPTDPRYTAANLERTEVIRHEVPCGPCHLKECPTDHRCMAGIAPEEVLARIEDLDRRLSVFQSQGRESDVGSGPAAG